MGAHQNERVELEDGRVVLYRRDDVKKPVWHCRISFPEIPYKNKRFTTRKYDLEDAKKVALKEFRRMEYLHEDGRPVFTKTFQQVWNTFIEEQRLRNKRGDLSEGRMRFFESTGTFYFLPHFGSKQICKIHEADIHSYWEFRRSYWRTGPGKERLHQPDKALRPKLRLRKPDKNAPSKPMANKVRRVSLDPAMTTLELEAGLLKQVFELARRNRDVTTDQIPKIKLPEKIAKTSRPSFSREEWNLFCAKLPEWVEEAASNPAHSFARRRMECFVHIMYGTGMRVPNAYNLRWKHYTTFYGTDGNEYIKLEVTGKINKGKPYTVVGDIGLKKWFDILRTLTPNNKPDDYVFGNRDGSQLTHIDDHFRRLLTALELRCDTSGQPRTPYSLRHTMATHALTDGVDIHTLAKAMNTSVAMIEAHYDKTTNETKAPALLSNRTKQITLGSKHGLVVSVPPDSLFGSQASGKDPLKKRNKK